MEIEVTTPLYSAKRLRQKLSRIRGGEVPPETLRRWRRALEIYPDGRLYSTDDYLLLKGLVQALKAGLTIAEYRLAVIQKVQKVQQKVQQENQNHA